MFDGDESVLEKIGRSDAIYLPAIVVGELYYGAYNSGKKDKNISRIDLFKTQVSGIPCDDSTAKIYGKIKKELKDKGQPIPEDDIWIAAIAIQHNLTLVTRDKHFSRFANLETETW